MSSTLFDLQAGVATLSKECWMAVSVNVLFENIVQ